MKTVYLVDLNGYMTIEIFTSLARAIKFFKDNVECNLTAEDIRFRFKEENQAVFSIINEEGSHGITRKPLNAEYE